MNFCMVTTFYPPANFGGDGLFVQALSRALAARGHAVTVVYCEDAYRATAGRPAPAPEVDPLVTVEPLRSRLGLLSPALTQQLGRPVLKRGALTAILQRGYDVVNFHNISLIGGPGVLTIPAAGALKLYTLHEHWLLCTTHVLWQDRVRRCRSRACLRCAIRSGTPPQAWRLGGFRDRALASVDALLAPSRFTADLHRADGITRPIEVLPLFSRLQPDDSGAAGTDGRDARFLYVGRVTASKGIAELLAAVEPSAHCLDVAGEGDLLPALRARYAGCGRIRFHGRLDAAALAQAYRAARAVIVPSLAPETFGLAVVEALAAGVPAIVRDSGGCAEIVRDCGVGFVYSTPAQLRACMDTLAADHALRARWSMQARAQYGLRFGEQRYIDAYLDLIARRASGHARAREAVS